MSLAPPGTSPDQNRFQCWVRSWPIRAQDDEQRPMRSEDGSRDWCRQQVRLSNWAGLSRQWTCDRDTQWDQELLILTIADPWPVDGGWCVVCRWSLIMSAATSMSLMGSSKEFILKKYFDELQKFWATQQRLDTGESTSSSSTSSSSWASNKRTSMKSRNVVSYAFKVVGNCLWNRCLVESWWGKKLSLFGLADLQLRIAQRISRTYANTQSSLAAILQIFPE